MTDYTVSVMHFFLYIAHLLTIYLRLKFWFIYEALLKFHSHMGIAHIVLRPFLRRSNCYFPFIPHQHRLICFSGGNARRGVRTY